MISKADEGQSNTWDFPVFQEELQTKRGIGSGMFAVIREDTGKVVGEYRGLKMLPNTEMVQRFETMVSEAGETFKQVSALTTKDGSRFFAKYQIGNETKIVGESYGKVVTLVNSYDGSLTPELDYSMLRIRCLNGVISLASVTNIRDKKHALTFDLISQVSRFIAGMAEAHKGTTEAIEEMTRIKLNDAQADNVLANLVSNGKNFSFAEKHAVLIQRNWRNPVADEKPLGDTLYRLYNAATRYARDVERVGRFELSQRTNAYIGDAFGLSLRQKSFAQRFLAPSPLKIDFNEYAVN